MTRALRICLIVLGVSAVSIALSIIVTGAEATATLAEGTFGRMSGWEGAPPEHWPATMDSELRFYAALWGAYGLVVLRAAVTLPASLPQVPWIAAVFFAGGAGRALSYFGVGAPHPFFSVLMAIELMLPLVMVWLWFGARAKIPGSPVSRRDSVQP